MNIMLRIFTVLTVCCAITSAAYCEQGKDEVCLEPVDKSTLINGWYLWPPYQFNQVSIGGAELTGMDVELVKKIAAEVGVEVTYELVPWSQHQSDLRSGSRDIAAGATYTDARATFVHFSEPYRFEENSLFVSKVSRQHLSFNSIDKFLAQVRIHNFRLGVIDGFMYADPKINAFIADDINTDIIFKYSDDTKSLQGLMADDIDGFLADRLVGAAVIIEGEVGDIVKEVPLHIKTPIHLMFSKQTVSTDMVGRFNAKIAELKQTKEYKEIVRNYLYPVLLLQTINADWFYILNVIGTIAFAVSGIAIAARENHTLFTTLILAFLPSLGGGMLRDLVANRETIGIFLAPEYMYYVMVTVLVGMALVRLLYSYTGDKSTDLESMWDGIIRIGDSIGQSVFIVVGITVAIMAKLAPIVLWGPFFAFITAHGGGMLRDLFRGRAIAHDTEDTLGPEISLIWGVVFSLLLDYHAYNPNPDNIRNTVLVCITGAFVCRMLVYKYKIPNIRYRH